jgi:hypothetical protein
VPKRYAGAAPGSGASCGEESELIEDVHEWLSFDHDGDTYLFDVSFLTSNYTCIYGQGCPGILEEPEPELEHGCCSFGAHFVDKEDRKRVAALVDELTADEWQLRARARTLGGPIHKNEHGEWVTRLVDGACIFLNRPGWHAGAGCALHQAAWNREERPLDWKPAVCWQVPMRLEGQVDDLGHTTWVLREWKRRDWGEGGADFHWWCTTDDDLAFVGHEPVYLACRDEIVELVGEAPYDKLLAHLKDRPLEHHLPHPALKVRATSTTGDR